MKYYKKFESEDVYLSPMNLLDAEEYTKWLNDRDITDKLGNTVFINNVESEKEWLLNAGKNGDCNFAIIRKEDDTLIGNCSLMDISRVNQRATLGIFIGDKSPRNRGYGAQAIRLLLEYGFMYQNLNNICLEVFKFNERAIKCYKKCGFKEYGVRRESAYINGEYVDDVLMQILKSEYLELK